MKATELDMTHGPLWNKIIIFALPLALTAFLQQLYNAADVAVVGRFVGTEAMAAVGTNVSLIGLLINLFMGISLGANVMIARYIGGRDEEKARAAVHTAFLLALAVGLGLMLLGQLIARPVLALLEVPDSVMGMAEAYLRVFLCGMPFMGLYNFQAADCPGLHQCAEFFAGSYLCGCVRLGHCRCRGGHGHRPTGGCRHAAARAAAG